MKFSTLFLFVTLFSFSKSSISQQHPSHHFYLSDSQPFISEFLAASIKTGNNEQRDWIEIYNPSESIVSLSGWSLSDDSDNPEKWIFPELFLSPGAYLLIYCTGKDLSTDFRNLHSNFKLDPEGEFLGLFDSNKRAISFFDGKYPRQYNGITYGYDLNSSTEGYFTKPTPGHENGISLKSRLDAPVLNHKRGFYDSPFTINYESYPIEGVQVRYTTNGENPGKLTGKLFEDNLFVIKSNVIKFVALKEGYLPSKIVTHSYFFSRDIVKQSLLNKKVTYDPSYRDQLSESFESLPSLSLVLNSKDMFRGSNAIYANPWKMGFNWEKPVSFEVLERNGAGIQINAGIRIHGADARNHVKKPFKIYFRKIYDDDNFSYNFFRNEKHEVFDKLILRGCGHDAWTSIHAGQDSTGTYLRDAFMRQAQGDMGNPSVRGRFFHLFLNGRYWGVYNIQERPDAQQCARNYGGDLSEWDVIKGITDGPFVELVDGNLNEWNEMIKLSNEYGSLKTNGVKPSLYNQLSKFLNYDHYVDSILLRVWAGDVDWIRSQNELAITGNRNKNWYASRNRMRPEGFLFFPWDAEFTLGKTHSGSKKLDFNLTDIHINNSPATMYASLKEDPEFRLKFADRIFKHFKPEGALSEQVNTARWINLVDSIRKALILESARWGGWKFPKNPYTIDNYWQDEVNWIRDVWIPKRNNLVLQQFKNIGLYPENDPPRLSINKQEKGSFYLMLSNNAPSKIYYNLDGLDPRDVQQLTEINRKAHLYEKPLEITPPKMIQVSARSRNPNGAWSPLNQQTFWLDVVGPSQDNTIISEIMYNPPSYLNQDCEYIEIMNIGNRLLDLKGSMFVSGIYHQFNQNTLLQPGHVLLLVKNKNAFEAAYPLVKVGGVYDGKLSNRGERIQYLDHNGRPIADFTYDDGDFVLTDGKGYSVYQHSTRTDISNPSSTLPWVQGNVLGGTPGSPNTNSGFILRISRGQTGADKGLILVFQANFSVKAELQYSQDLVSWAVMRKIEPQDEPIYTIPLTQGFGSGRAFYRVLYQP